MSEHYENWELVGLLAGFLVAAVTLYVTSEPGISALVLLAAVPTLAAAGRELNGEL